MTEPRVVCVLGASLLGERVGEVAAAAGDELLGQDELRGSPCQQGLAGRDGAGKCSTRGNSS